eukprot:CAMPEP_0198295090 /NCGR_PEP_ID=MMETSP1449-20131203/25817_1 /TAXON_ID=420275 /ORGANISM="Attheya septentrionalis, Strain CCMP2084" /LENGTH=250 /DNA_ID=CAMNT_0043995277 /DNA_START=164 /DNA_END=916 /DNA_ORIENTATION=+
MNFQVSLPGKKLVNELSRLILDEDWATAEQYCRAYPKEAKEWSVRSGFFEGLKDSNVLPLHSACALRPPPTILNALLRAYPRAIMAKESAYSRLPLHIACRSGADATTVACLIGYFPGAAQVEDTLGRLPIHYALSNGSKPDVIDALLRTAPNAARAYDRRGWLPIHVACSVGASFGVVVSLIEAYPASSVLVTEKGSTPLKCLDLTQPSSERDQIASYLRRARKNYEKSRDGEVKVAKRPAANSTRYLI